MKKFFSSKSRRMKEAQDFYDKIKYKEETLRIQRDVNEKKKEIDLQKKKIASLFIDSNAKQDILRNYIAEINKKIYDSNIETDVRIEGAYEEITNIITNLQKKMQLVIQYTKNEMEHQIKSKFETAQENQRIQMQQQVDEGNKLIKNLNFTKFKLEKTKMDFEESNVECEKLIEKNNKLLIKLDNSKSDYKNLLAKKEEIEKENEKLLKEIDSISDRNSSYNSSQKLLKNSAGNSLSQSQEYKNAVPNTENSNIKDAKNEQYTPNFMIVVLKNSIKDYNMKIRELTNKISEEKKEKNEAMQLLQKCIDDLNNYNKRERSRISKLPFINNNDTRSNAYFELTSTREMKDNVINQKILTYIYDNVFINVMDKNLFYTNKTTNKFHKASSQIKENDKFRKITNYNKTFY